MSNIVETVIINFKTKYTKYIGKITVKSFKLRHYLLAQFLPFLYVLN